MMINEIIIIKSIYHQPRGMLINNAFASGVFVEQNTMFVKKKFKLWRRGGIRTLDSIATIHAFQALVEKLSLDFLQKFKNGILKNNIYVNFYFATTKN